MSAPDVRDELVAAARAGDEQAFRDLTQPHLRELHVHCYRMLGSFQDAEDALQDTLERAWRHLESFEGRAPFRAWLYRIATNACLKAAGRRRELPMPENGGFDVPMPTPNAPDIELGFIEPYPDALLDELGGGNPAARY